MDANYAALEGFTLSKKEIRQLKNYAKEARGATPLLVRQLSATGLAYIKKFQEQNQVLYPAKVLITVPANYGFHYDLSEVAYLSILESLIAAKTQASMRRNKPLKGRHFVVSVKLKWPNPAYPRMMEAELTVHLIN